MLTSLEIGGLRGFAAPQTIALARPTGKPGSGLTVIVGANNTGKSTVIEALRAVAQNNPPSFTQGRRNQTAGDKVQLRVSSDENKVTILRSIRPGSSETEYVKENGGVDLRRLLVLPARRVFNPYFGRAEYNRDQYMAGIGFPPIRTSSLDQFTNRLFAIEKNRGAFDEILKRVVQPIPDWSIDQMDNGQYFLKFKKQNATHSSEGLGEGLVSLLYIIDALYDSKESDTIAIDEPELSLHPALQRNLSQLFSEYSATRQIVLSTHSPYFIGLDVIPNGGTVARTYIRGEESKISQLSDNSAKAILGLMSNANNPHIFGLLAQEIFFVEDRVILSEGQEDVIFLNRAAKATQPLMGTFFGWGVGGAENMERIATILKELGFSKVVGILDGNRADLAGKLSAQFPKFHFFAIPADDVRTKAAVPAKSVVIGLLDDQNESIRPEYAAEVRRLFQVANKYLGGK
ncbi:MAG TPA: AAA family ATPase [Chthoniobacterales bacterium]|nr:AAA family ATPase [Chthoniobacterales bacterium]